MDEISLNVDFQKSERLSVSGKCRVVGICQKGHREEAFGLRRSVQRPGGRMEGGGDSQLSVKSEEALAGEGAGGDRETLRRGQEGSVLGGLPVRARALKTSCHSHCYSTNLVFFFFPSILKSFI